MQVNRLPTALGIILVLQTILDHLKLKLTHCSHNAATIKLIDKQLCHTLVHQLLQSLLELLALHRIIILDILEEQWREGWQTAEVNLLTLGQRITNLEDAIVWQTYDIARISLVDGTLALRHKLGWRRETHGLVEAHVIVRLIAHKLAEQILQNAMQERWLGSILAVILKMKPVNLGSSGSTMRSSALVGLGDGAI